MLLPYLSVPEYGRLKKLDNNRQRPVADIHVYIIAIADNIQVVPKIPRQSDSGYESSIPTRENNVTLVSLFEIIWSLDLIK